MPKRLVFGNGTSIEVGSSKPVEQAPAPRVLQLGTQMPAPKPIQMNGTISSPPSPVASAPKVMSFGSAPATELNSYVAEALIHDPLIQKNPMFMPRLRACLGLKPLQWMNWADDRMEILRTAAKTQVDVNMAFRDLKASEWVDQAREQASKKPGLFDMLKSVQSPDWYDAQLDRCRKELTTLAVTAQKARDDLHPKMVNLMLDNIVFQVVSKRNPDPAASQIAHSKIQTMLSGIQMGQLAEQSLQSTLTSITTTIQAIDTVRTNVIPAWQIANSKR